MVLHRLDYGILSFVCSDVVGVPLSSSSSPLDAALACASSLMYLGFCTSAIPDKFGEREKGGFRGLRRAAVKPIIRGATRFNC